MEYKQFKHFQRFNSISFGIAFHSTFMMMKTVLTVDGSGGGDGELEETAYPN